MTRWKVWGGLALLFLSGTLIGGAVTHYCLQSQAENRWEEGPKAKKQWMMQRLTRSLDLTADQQAKLAPIVGQAQDNLLALRAQQQPQVEAIWTKTLDAVKPSLSTEQQQKLETFHQKLQRRWKKTEEYLREMQAPPH
ncbi:MAG: hypothetical protein ACKOCD_09245 [Nitrospiraceae bacterium]